MNVARNAYIYYRGRMKNEMNLSTMDKLKTENPIQYYLKHTGNQRIMSELKRTDRLLYLKILRIDYIKSFQAKEPLYTCPECGEDITQDEWGEEYCPSCGLVTRSNYPYVAGQEISFPYGVKL